MKFKLFKILLFIILLVLILGGVYFIKDNKSIGSKIDSYKNVDVYYNGVIYTKAYGKNYSKDGYYYGQKWQCVEYVKRFYYLRKGHKMPDVFGHAKDFFDSKVQQGEVNKQRGLVQYRNGDNVKPEVDDIIVFSATKLNKFGHVAIVTEVSSNYVEVIQQNILGKPRERLELIEKDNKYFVKTRWSAIGWLRKE